MKEIILKLNKREVEVIKAAVKVRAIKGVNASLDLNTALYNEAMKLVA